MARNTPPTPHAAFPSVRKSARWKPRIIEKCFGRGSLMARIGMRAGPLVPDVLQEPLGRDLVAGARGARRLVDASRHRVELGALQVPPLRIRDLVRRGAARVAARDQVGEP